MKIDFKRKMFWGDKYVATIVGTENELKMLELLCDKTHHIHKNPTGRRDNPKTCGTCKQWHRNGDVLKPIGMCKNGNSTVGVDNDTNIYDTCDKWEVR